MSTQGFPDFRRQADYDQSIILQQNATVLNGIKSFGTFFVGNFAYLEGVYFNSDAWSRLILEYSEDSLGSQSAGSRTFHHSTSVPLVLQFRTPIFGRYVTISYAPTGAGNYTVSALYFGTNRPASRELIPQKDILVQNVAIIIGAGGNTAATAEWYATGTATLYMETGATPGVFTVEVEKPSGTWVRIAGKTVAAGVSDTLLLSLPAYPVRVVIQNTGGVNGTYSSVLTIGGIATTGG